MNKKLLTVLAVASLTVTSVVTPYMAYAEDVNSQIEKAKNQVENLTNKLSEAEKELANVSAQITEAEEKSAQLQEAMTQTQKTLTTLTEDIKTLEEIIAKRTVKLQTQARAEQTENTLENYLGVILSSRSIVDAIERFNAISALVTSGAEMREQQVRDKENVENKKVEVEKKLVEQSQNAKELSDLQNELSVKKAEREVYVSSIAIEKASAEKDKKDLEAKRDEAIRQAEAAKKAEAERIAKLKAAQEQQAKEQQARNALAAQQVGQGIATATSSQQSITSQADVSIGATSSAKGQAIAAAALAQLGVMQDCTRLATNALRAAGINYHGWPIGYMSLGTVVSAAEAQPGDLIYYANGGMGLAHIAVYIGNGKAVHGGWNGNTTVVNTAYVGSGPVFIRVK
ncbi:C40 family peptidase [Carnobacteriaceae bacterium zg-ZUI78]|nr:C40 family peptidase [Carnobacteriaceae bacterium zg-ZUI78]